MPSIRSTSFYCSSINDLISKFENSQKIPTQIASNADHSALNVPKIPRNNSQHPPIRMGNYSNNLMHNCSVLASSGELRERAKPIICSGDNNRFFNYNKWWKQSAIKMVDSISDDVKNDCAEYSDNEQTIQRNGDRIVSAETFDDAADGDGDGDDDDDDSNASNEFNMLPLIARKNSACNAAMPSKFTRLKNINIVRCQLNIVQRLVGILVSFPFLASVNGAGLSTLTCAFFLPRFLCQNLLYPIFRLILGTLYPAYASYKAVRNKDVKDYVSSIVRICLIANAPLS